MAAESLVSTLKANPISVACGALALALAVGIYVRGSGVSEGEALLEQKTTLGERIDANLKNGVQLNDQYNAISASRKEIESRLVRADEIAKNLQFFYKLESETRVKLIDCNQNGGANLRLAKTKGFYRPVSYSVSVRGDYSHLLDFMRRLESRQRFCRINTASVTLSGGTDNQRGNELTITLSLELLGLPSS